MGILDLKKICANKRIAALDMLHHFDRLFVERENSKGELAKWEKWLLERVTGAVTVER